MNKARFGFLCSLILTLFLGCDDNLQELTLEEEKQSNGITTFKAPFTNFPELGSLFEETVTTNIQKFEANKNDIYNFKIDSNSVIKKSFKNDDYYTFRITREKDIWPSFENLVISNKEGLEPEAFIFKYIPNEDFIQNFKENPNTVFSGNIEAKPLDYNRLLTASGGCISFTTDLCNYSGHIDNGLGDGVAGPGCSDTTTITTTICFIGANPFDGGGGGGGSGNGTGAGGGSTTSSQIELLYSDVITDTHISPYHYMIEKLSYAIGSIEADYILENPELRDELLLLLYNNNYSSDALKATKMTVETFSRDIHYSEVGSAFPLIIDEYNNFDINFTNTSQTHIWFVLRCTELKALHPEWSEWRVTWEASKDFIHVTLDVLGLVPGVGEPADLVNGLIYFAEGDRLSGTLSLSAAIPFAGWSATGSKWAIKVVKFANGTKIALQISKKANGLFDFGKKSSRVFRNQLGLTVGDGLIGHHVIPWNLNNERLVQVAADFKWHPHDAALNGKIVSSTRHSGSHSSYDNFVRNRMNQIVSENPGILQNPELAFNKLKELSNQLQGVIDTNPSKKINELF